MVKESCDLKGKQQLDPGIEIPSVPRVEITRFSPSETIGIDKHGTGVVGVEYIVDTPLQSQAEVLPPTCAVTKLGIEQVVGITKLVRGVR